MSGTLFLVATPIGNLGDLSRRAAETLAQADFIAAEDTRVTLKLLNHLGLRKPLVSYYEHNQAHSGARILERLRAGACCALVTDAGMPAVSDPGEGLVRLCAEAGIAVTVIPGPSAFAAALALSGLPTGRFTFEGFLSTTKKRRLTHLEELKAEKRTMIFYEAPHKLLPTLRDMLAIFGDRRVALCRELTKLHEEIIRTTLSAAAARYTDTPARGEFVLVIEGAAPVADTSIDPGEALEQVNRLLGQGVSLKDAARSVAQRTGIPKNDLYNAALKQDPAV